MDKEKVKGSQIEVKPMDPPKTSIDTDNSLEQVILDAAVAGDLRSDIFESFSTTAQTRESLYELIDTMAMDSTIAAAIETYAEDITQPNSNGDVIWAESNDPEVAKYVNYLLKKVDVNKQAFSWAYNLVKYGDVYLRLLRKSDFENSKLFNSEKNKKKKGKSDLKEDVNLIISRKNDHYAHCVEMQKNPNEMFELTKFGKSMAYVKAGVNVQKDFSTNNDVSYFTRYKLQKKDVDIYSPMEFVHACSESSTSRAEEELDIFFDAEGEDKDALNCETFQVRRGTGILNDLFKVWRQLSLLENSVLLNRLTRSSIVRAIQMEVGDMPANQVMNVTSRIKNLVENKTALDTGKKMSEYTNPGPLENTIVIPTRNGKGTISIQTIGGEVDPKQLTDLDWFNNKLFGGIKIPKQFFGFTDDAAGFSGGQSLAQYDARYGKAVKRFQADICLMITDMINLFLIDVGNKKFINRFKIKMQPPVTQEEIDKKQDLSNTLRNIGDIMNTLNDVQTTSAKLKILKSLLSQCLSDQEIITVLQEEIDKLENEEKAKNAKANPEDNTPNESNYGGGGFEESPQLSGMNDFNPETEEIPEESVTVEPEASEGGATEAETGGAEETLPSFEDLGVDGTVNL